MYTSIILVFVLHVILTSGEPEAMPIQYRHVPSDSRFPGVIGNMTQAELNALLTDFENWANGFTPTGVFSTANTYIFNFDGTDYSASNAYQLIYGGPDDAGEVDGADSVAVIQAVIDDLAATGGSLHFKLAEYNIEGLSLGLNPVDLHFNADLGTRFIGDGGGRLITFGGHAEDAGGNITFENIIFDTTMQEPLDWCNAVSATGGTFSDIRFRNCQFYVSQALQTTPGLNFEYTNPIYFTAAINGIWVDSCNFYNNGTGTSRCIAIRGGGRNAWITNNMFYNMNNPAMCATGTENYDFKGWHYINNKHVYSEGLNFPCEGPDLENLENALISGTVEIELGELDLGVGEGAGGIVCGSGSAYTGGPVNNVMIENCVLRNGTAISLGVGHTTNIKFGSNNINYNYPYFVFSDGVAAAFGGLGVTVTTPTPSLPVAAGIENAVANPYTWDVEVYVSADGLQPFYLDRYGRYVALPDVNQTMFILHPKDSLYWGTTVPSSWVWVHNIV